MSGYRNLLGSDRAEYEETPWFDDAVDRITEAETIGTPDLRTAYSWKKGFRRSHWFGFQEAAKAHRAAALKVLAPTFGKMELSPLL